MNVFTRLYLDDKKHDKKICGERYPSERMLNVHMEGKCVYTLLN